MSRPGPDVTTLLGLATQGDAKAQSALYRLVEGELRHRARAYLRHEGRRHALQTTLLVDDAFIKLVGAQSPTWENRAQFYCLAARVMRELLVDEARRRTADKRGRGAEPARLDDVAEPSRTDGLDPLTILALHEALTTLAATEPDLIQIVELHHYGGWELKQIADDILHIPYVTVKRRWQKARALLYRALSGGDPDVAASPTEG
jgi:RNA polymerase sigma factor (TIGR02999 family)